jgi:hypothetical protein
MAAPRVLLRLSVLLGLIGKPQVLFIHASDTNRVTASASTITGSDIRNDAVIMSPAFANDASIPLDSNVSDATVGCVVSIVTTGPTT